MSHVKHCPDPNCPHLERCGEPAEYRSHVDVCANCGAALISGPAPKATPDEFEPGPIGDSVSPLVTVAVCRQPGQAHLLGGMLESAGIPYNLAGEHSTGMFGAALLTRIQVPEVNEAEARQLLGEVGASLDGSGPGHVEAEARIEGETADETRRRGMKPLVFFLIVLFVVLVFEVLRRFD